MNKKWIAIAGSGMLVAGLVVAGVSLAKSGGNEVRGGTIRLGKQAEADFPALARVTSDQAVQKALDAVQGKVVKMELENENGFLVYGVEVVTPGRDVMEVKVDAGSGEVLAMNQDKTDDDDQESGGHGGDRDTED